ncbi:hypothetical protein K8U54_12950 [Pseudomonas fulva]|uniref:DUF7210 family protein n=1 Tax=Pseudomonas fulva TaxID=47880 RepID=UPI00201D9390|nr:hypothetical protein [Pseudomonas fulva]UQY32652.1 hypothetical protein K8U54_12950 [Pseudomonas fulva]
MSTKDPKPAEIKRVKVKLIADHKHAGVEYAKDAEIEVTEAEKDWLVRHKKIEGPAEPAAPAATK